jgi:hypothetical protein
MGKYFQNWPYLEGITRASFTSTPPPPPKEKTTSQQAYMDHRTIALCVTGNNQSDRHIDASQEADFVIL